MKSTKPELHTLVLSRSDIAAIAGPLDYIEAVDAAFRGLADGTLRALPVGHVGCAKGGFHIKAGVAEQGRNWVVIKVNGNFPSNPVDHGLPTIQGCIVLADGADGRLLALLDSIEITAQRTAAASAVAARWLARADSSALALVGCGIQARYHLDALLALGASGAFQLRTLRCFDLDRGRAERLAALGASQELDAQVAGSVHEACRDADLVVSCTPSAVPLLESRDIAPGCFVAAVGADHAGKCELAPQLLHRARVVPDLVAQAATIGDLRSAIEAGLLGVGDIHAELAQIVAGQRPGRSSPEQIFVFDSTGTAVQDLAAAAMVYQRACANPQLLRIDLNGLAAG